MWEKTAKTKRVARDKAIDTGLQRPPSCSVEALNIEGYEATTLVPKIAEGPQRSALLSDMIFV
jgi:hypothetical protein